jgi:hypothetical protein
MVFSANHDHIRRIKKPREIYFRRHNVMKNFRRTATLLAVDNPLARRVVLIHARTKCPVPGRQIFLAQGV